ncbi:MAG: SDR family oxidoreductase [Candidatus Sericytochromatia bacterium]|nr:SDR family oxidoreductase [Candidatus Tanganyikabacteria bacterium]
MADPEIVLITGSRKGIGRHLAEHFLERGALVEGCSREPAGWDHPRYTHHLADVTDEPAVRAMLAAIARRHRRLDILVNNAGLAAMNHTLLTPLAQVERVMATNFTGTFLVCREAAKVMQRRKYGRIVNLGSVAVPLKLEGEAVYAASKSAVEAFTRILARELGPMGITVNVVGPAPTDTDLIRGVPEGKIAALVARQAITRKGTFEDVANVVDFFTSPRSGFVTGQVVYLGGI